MKTYRLTGVQVDALANMGLLPVEEAMAVKTHGFLLLNNLVEPHVVPLDKAGDIVLRSIHHEANKPFVVELEIKTDDTTARDFYKGYLEGLGILERA